MKDKFNIDSDFSQAVANVLDRASDTTDEATLQRLSEIRNSALCELDS